MAVFTTRGTDFQYKSNFPLSVFFGYQTYSRFYHQRHWWFRYQSIADTKLLHVFLPRAQRVFIIRGTDDHIILAGFSWKRIAVFIIRGTDDLMTLNVNIIFLFQFPLDMNIRGTGGFEIRTLQTLICFVFFFSLKHSRICL